MYTVDRYIHVCSSCVYTGTGFQRDFAFGLKLNSYHDRKLPAPQDCHEVNEVQCLQTRVHCSVLKVI